MARKNFKFLVNYRLNGGEKFGLGHAYRAIHLQQELKNKVEFFFIINNDKYLEKLFSSNNLNYIKLYKLNSHREKKLLTYKNPNLIIFDILNTKSNNIDYYSKKNIKTLSFEDLGTGANKCDIVINAITCGIRNNIIIQDSITKYFGPKYKVLSKDFDKLKIRNNRKLFLIILGGSLLYKNELLKIIENVLLINNLELKLAVIVGSAVNEKSEEFKKLTLLSNYNHIELYHNPKNIKKIFLNTKIALIGGGGSLIYEMIRFKIPFLVIKRVNHQLRNINYIKNLKFSSFIKKININELEKKIKYLLDIKNYNRSLLQMNGIVDGQGRKRVSNIILGLCKK